MSLLQMRNLTPRRVREGVMSSDPGAELGFEALPGWLRATRWGGGEICSLGLLPVDT